MQEEFQSRDRDNRLEVSHPKAIKFLKDPERSALLGPFMQQPRSLSEGSQQCDISLNKLHYNVRQLLSWGLLNVAHVEKREGCAVKFYVTSARASSYDLLIASSQDRFVETELAHSSRLAEAVKLGFLHLIQSDLHNGERGRLYYLDHQGDLGWIGRLRLDNELAPRTFSNPRRFRLLCHVGGDGALPARILSLRA